MLIQQVTLKYHFKIKETKPDLSYMPIPFFSSLFSRTFLKMMLQLLCEHVIPLLHKINFLLLISCSQEFQGISFGGKGTNECLAGSSQKREKQRNGKF